MKVSEQIIKEIELIELIEKKAKIDIKNLLLKSARENNPFKVGDILKDHFQIGIVLKFSYSYCIATRSYDIIYLCERLTRRLKPFKNKEKINIYLCNVKEKL